MMKKRILLTGARAIATLDLARKFKYWGHEVYVADSVKYPICRYSSAVKKCFVVPSPMERSVYIQAISDLIKAYRIDLLIPACEEIFYISNHLNQLKRLTNVFSECFDQLILLHNKFSFNQLIKEMKETASDNHAISIPKTTLITDSSQYYRLIQQGGISYPHVLKPVYSRFGTQVKFVFKPEDALKLDFLKNKTWIAQAYIAGKTISSYGLCHKGKLLSNVFYKSHYLAGKTGAGISFESVESVPLFQWISQLVKQLNYTGHIAFDVIKTSNGQLWPIECNPRLTSGIHLMEDHHNIPRVFLEHRRQGFFDAIGQKEQFRKKTNRAIKLRVHPMLSLAMLRYGLPSAKTYREFLAWIQCFIRGKEIIFRWRDPIPFIAQFLCVINFFYISRKNRISFIEAMTYDIEWNNIL